MESDTLPPGTLVAGRYRIVRELGRGGMGAVYVAEHVNTGGLWALKVLLDCSGLQADRAARFRREARASARITSDHVVRVTDADTAPELGGAPFLVMELLEGEDIERLLAKRGKLEPHEALNLLVQVARGLDKAHAAGVVHRDLKPENLFIHRREDGSEIVKVLDFGISKVLRPDGDLGSAGVTGATDIMGTPLYMAPEQAAARHEDVGPATDVWAIGLMTVRLLTGQVYWTGQTIPEVFVQIMAERRDAPSERWPELGVSFDRWFAKSVALRAADRFQSVGEQIAELSVVLGGERPIARSWASPPPAIEREARRAPQFVTQPIAGRPDSPSSRPVGSLAVSTSDPVMSATTPPRAPRRTAMVIGAAVAIAVGLGAVTLLRSSGGPSTQSSTGHVVGGESAATGAQPEASVSLAPTANPSSLASALATSSAGAPTTVGAGAPLVPPAVGRPPAPPAARPPQGLTAGASLVIAPASASPPSSASAKPVAKPADLFDTQR